jgi:isoamylase
MPNPPVLWDIESDPALAGTKMIAEAWGAAGLYQVGSFVGDSWKEWNDRFRDDVRDFFRGANDSVGRIADRLLGSPSIYGQKEREAADGIERRQNEHLGSDAHQTAHQGAAETQHLFLAG